MTEQELRNRIKTGKVAGVYLLAGSERFMLRHYRAGMRAAVIKDTLYESFNRITLEGQSGLLALPSAADGMPMGDENSDMRIIELYGVDFCRTFTSEEAACDVLAAFDRIAKSGDTCLVAAASEEEFDFGTDSKPSKLFKLLSKHMNIVKIEKREAPQLREWITRHFEHEGISVPSAETGFLMTYCGSDMDRLSGEIDKLCCYLRAAGRRRVSRDDIMLVCSPSAESENFAFENAIRNGDTAASFTELAGYRFRNESALIPLTRITSVYSDMLLARAYADEGKSADELHRMSGLHEYVAKLLMRAARALPADTLEAVLSECEKTEMFLKSASLYDDYAAVEKLLAVIAYLRAKAARAV